MTNRLDVRLDSERRSRLEELAREKDLPISKVVRKLIDDAYEVIDRERRLRAVERMAAMEIDVPEDPEELCRILSGAHDPGPFIDTNIPIYAVGREHRYKQFALRIMAVAADYRQAFMTDSEVLQEIVHYYTSARRWSQGRTILDQFAETMRDRIEPVYAEDVLLAGVLVDQYQGVGARDLIHVAIMRRLGLTRIISADAHFDRIDAVERLDPARLAEWESSI